MDDNWARVPTTPRSVLETLAAELDGRVLVEGDPDTARPPKVGEVDTVSFRRAAARAMRVATRSVARFNGVWLRLREDRVDVVGFSRDRLAVTGVRGAVATGPCDRGPFIPKPLLGVAVPWLTGENVEIGYEEPDDDTVRVSLTSAGITVVLRSPYSSPLAYEYLLFDRPERTRTLALRSLRQALPGITGRAAAAARACFASEPYVDVHAAPDDPTRLLLTSTGADLSDPQTFRMLVRT